MVSVSVSCSLTAVPSRASLIASTSATTLCLPKSLPNPSRDSLLPDLTSRTGCLWSILALISRSGGLILRESFVGLGKASWICSSGLGNTGSVMAYYESLTVSDGVGPERVSQMPSSIQSRLQQRCEVADGDVWSRDRKFRKKPGSRESPSGDERRVSRPMADTGELVSEFAAWTAGQDRCRGTKVRKQALFQPQLVRIRCAWVYVNIQMQGEAGKAVSVDLTGGNRRWIGSRMEWRAVAGSLSWWSRRRRWCGCAKPQEPTTAKQPRSDDVMKEGWLEKCSPGGRGKDGGLGVLDCERREDKAGLCEMVDNDVMLATLGRTWR